MQGIGEVLTSSNTDLTLFRVPFLYDEKQPTSNSEIKTVDTGRFGEGYKGGNLISRQSICRWVLKEIREYKYPRQVVAIGEMD
jgi:hypothetical protein